MIWTLSHKYDKHGAALADGHYSRRKIGSPQFMPPGETVVLVAPGAVFGWWRPHPRSGLRAMNGHDGWTCTIFRRVSGPLASDMILEAELALDGKTCGPSGRGRCSKKPVSYDVRRKVLEQSRTDRGLLVVDCLNR